MTARVSKVLILIALAVFFYALTQVAPTAFCDPGMPRHMYMHCIGGK